MNTNFTLAHKRAESIYAAESKPAELVDYAYPGDIGKYSEAKEKQGQQNNGAAGVAEYGECGFAYFAAKYAAYTYGVVGGEFAILDAGQ